MDSAMITFLSQYGLLAIFIIITLEYACFPISSEVVLPVSGLIAAQLHHKITVVILISVVAGIIGSSVCYFAARCGRTVIPTKWINRFPKMKRRLQHTCAWQRQHGKTSVMFARVIPIFRTYISFASGLCRQSYWEFLLCSSIGILSWNTILISCGYLLGENFNVIQPYLAAYSKWVLVVLALLLFTVFFLKRRKRKKVNKPDAVR